MELGEEGSLMVRRDEDLWLSLLGCWSLTVGVPELPTTAVP